VRLADDRRGRVPFALVGILLLVGSAAFAASLSTTGPATLDRRTATALDRVAAGGQTALRSAATAAARDAAATPVTVPANSTVGRALDPDEPFRDALRLRIYVAARERLGATTSRHGSLTATASLPAPEPTESGVRRAIDRVDLAAAENGSALRVAIRNVSLVVSRDGRVVRRDRRTYRLTVDSPVLSMHDRTRRFERLLNRDPLSGPGLGRQLTARLHPIVWARAYAQYGGVPIQNVLANRHVELAANGGILAAQRRAFGRAAPGGRAARYRAAACVGLRDLVAPYESDHQAWARQVLDATGAPGSGGVPCVRRGSDPADRGRIGEALAGGASVDDLGSLVDAERGNRTVVVGVNRTADRALGGLVLSDAQDASAVGPARQWAAVNESGRERRLATVLRDGYRTTLRVETAVRRVEAGSRPAPDRPGPEWTLTNAIVEDSVRASSTDDAPAVDQPSGGAEWRALHRSSHRVTVVHTVRRTWRKGPQTTHTSATWRDRHRVGVALFARPRPSALAPDRPVSPAFRRGGPLDGPNLADLRERRRDLLARWGGPRSIARGAVRGTLDGSPRVAVGDRPDRLRGWVLENVTDLRDRVRNVTVQVATERVAAGTANPPARLAERLRDRRPALLDAPSRYDGVADRARVAARAAYLDRVLAALAERANRTRRAGRGYESAIADVGVSGDESGVSGGESDVAATRDASVPGARAAVGAGPGGPVSLVPEGAPTYLPLGRLDGDRYAAVPDDETHTALAARNVNVFSVPYGDAVDGILDGALGGTFEANRTVRLRTGARALVVADESLARRPNATVRARRDRLRGEVANSLAGVRRAARDAVAAESSLTRAEAHGVVDDAFARWDGAGRRGLAAANGSAARRIATLAARRAGADDATAAALSVRVRAAVDRAVHERAARVDEGTVTDLSSAVRASGRTALGRLLRDRGKAVADDLVEEASRRRLGKAVTAVPAGMPVAPVPGYWYATANAWVVSVRGSFAAFAVRSRRVGASGSALRYVRDGTTATLDVDGDGRRERLGRAERVSFAANATVVVAVPAGKTGVGDVDGDADERSPGWGDVRPFAASVNEDDEAEPGG